MGALRIDEGTAMVAPKVRVGYLKQTAVAGSTKTVAEEAASGMKEITENKIKMEQAQRRIEDGDYSQEALNMLDIAMENFENSGGYNQDQVKNSTSSPRLFLSYCYLSQPFFRSHIPLWYVFDEGGEFSRPLSLI
jgi:ATPase subunit of ABC transporter with duplicated ATPase domains